MTIDEAAPDAVLRDRAVKRLKKRRDFYGHLLIYALLNGFLIVIWAVTGGGFFWPVFILVGWGIGVVMNAWDVYGHLDEFDEAQINREIKKMQRG